MNGLVHIVGAGTTTITADTPEDDTYRDGHAEYTLTVIDPDAVTIYTKVSTVTSGKTYLVVDKSNKYALTVGDNNATNNTTNVSPNEDNILSQNPDTYSDCEFVITADGDNYTFKNIKSDKYLMWVNGSNSYIGFGSGSTTEPITFTLPKGNEATSAGLFYFKSTKSGQKSGGSYNEWLYYNTSDTRFKIGGSGDPNETKKTDQGVILYEKQ